MLANHARLVIASLYEVEACWLYSRAYAKAATGKCDCGFRFCRCCGI